MTVGLRDFVTELGRQPLLFRETFRSRAATLKNGATLVGTGTTFSDGLVLNGSGNLLYNVSGSKILRAAFALVVETTFGFVLNDGADHFLYDFRGGVRAAHYLYKTAANTIVVVTAAATVLTVAYATWSAAVVAGKNYFVLSTTNGATSLWLNGTLIGTSATAWGTTNYGDTTTFFIGSNFISGSRWVGTISRFEIYGAVATTLDESKLRSGRLIQDLDFSQALSYLPGRSYYRRASDNLYVTEVAGKGTVSEALMGSDGTTLAQFPTIIKPNGFGCDGGDQINLGDNDQFSFTTGAADLPFSLSCLIQISDLSTFRPFICKGTSATVGEYLFYMNSNGRIRFLIIDNSTGGYVYRDSTVTLKKGTSVLVATYNGVVPATGIKTYINSVRVDTSDGSAGAYSRMRNTTVNLTVGIGAATYIVGSVILPAIWDFELSPMQVSALTARYRRLERAA